MTDPHGPAKFREMTVEKRLQNLERAVFGPKGQIPISSLAATADMVARTYEELHEFREESRAFQQEMRESLTGLGTELRTEMHESQAALRTEMHESQAALRAEMHESQAALRAEMRESQAELRAELRGSQAELRGELVAFGESTMTMLRAIAERLDDRN